MKFVFRGYNTATELTNVYSSQPFYFFISIIVYYHLKHFFVEFLSLYIIHSQAMWIHYVNIFITCYHSALVQNPQYSSLHY
jgi:hypothetical protein